jgi:hypothetical protein
VKQLGQGPTRIWNDSDVKQLGYGTTRTWIDSDVEARLPRAPTRSGSRRPVLPAAGAGRSRRQPCGEGRFRAGRISPRAVSSRACSGLPPCLTGGRPVVKSFDQRSNQLSNDAGSLDSGSGGQRRRLAAAAARPRPSRSESEESGGEGWAIVGRRGPVCWGDLPDFDRECELV